MQRDLAYIRDILEAAKLAVSYVTGVERQAFGQNTQLQDAVIRRLEIMGEAARRVSEETRTAHPGIPWRLMIGMRNQVIHMYDGVDMYVVWHTVKDDLPELINALERLMEAGRV
ncbi:MAG: DUF86 domain-containing protein [Nitrospirae bacterium]|nr:DUF86 domain-containing protein [Nitrospirota bacterium]